MTAEGDTVSAEITAAQAEFSVPSGGALATITPAGACSAVCTVTACRAASTVAAVAAITAIPAVRTAAGIAARSAAAGIATGATIAACSTRRAGGRAASRTAITPVSADRNRAKGGMTVIQGEGFRSPRLTCRPVCSRDTATAADAIHRRAGGSTGSTVATISAIYTVGARAAFIPTATVSSSTPGATFAGVRAEARIFSICAISSFAAEHYCLVGGAGFCRGLCRARC